MFEIASGYSVFVTQFSRCTENIQANDRIHSTSHDHVQSEYRKCIFQMQICGKTPNSGGKVHTRSCRMRYSNLLITWPTLATWVHRQTYFAFVHTRLEMYCTLEGKQTLTATCKREQSLKPLKPKLIYPLSLYPCGMSTQDDPCTEKTFLIYFAPSSNF